MKDTVLEGLKPFGIEAPDIFLTMSDTAATALKTGKEILEQAMRMRRVAPLLDIAAIEVTPALAICMF